MSRNNWDEKPQPFGGGQTLLLPFQKVLETRPFVIVHGHGILILIFNFLMCVCVGGRGHKLKQNQLQWKQIPTTLEELALTEGTQE